MAFLLREKANKIQAIDISNAQSMEIQQITTENKQQHTKLSIELPPYTITIDLRGNIECKELLKFLMRIKGEPALAVSIDDLAAKFSKER